MERSASRTERVPGLKARTRDTHPRGEKIHWGGPRSSSISTKLPNLGFSEIGKVALLLLTMFLQTYAFLGPRHVSSGERWAVPSPNGPPEWPQLANLG